MQNVSPRGLGVPVLYAVTGSAAAFGVAMVVDAQQPRARLEDYLPWARARGKGLLDDVQEWWRGLGPSRQTVAAIIAANAVVFALWRVPSSGLQHFLTTHFVHHGLSNRAFQMIGSALSHHNPIHFLVNMAAFWSFGPALSQALGQPQFLAFCFSGALFSALGSSAHARLASRALSGLGFSGVIFAIIGSAAVIFPHTEVGIIFLPVGSVNIQHALMGMMALDVLGIALGWRALGHAAHLGGTIFGILYARLGEVQYRKWARRLREFLRTGKF